MNTQQISNILKSDKMCTNVFKGVMPRDIFLQQDISYPSIFVCNTDDSSLPGTHWVSISFTKDKSVSTFTRLAFPLFLMTCLRD